MNFDISLNHYEQRNKIKQGYVASLRKCICRNNY